MIDFLERLVTRICELAAWIYQYGMLVIGIGMGVPMAIGVILAVPIGLISLLLVAFWQLNLWAMYWVVVLTLVSWWYFHDSDTSSPRKVRRGRTIRRHSPMPQRRPRVATRKPSFTSSRKRQRHWFKFW